MNSSHRQLVVRLTFAYAFVAALWILTSDWALARLWSHPRLFTWLSISKGWLFVAVTSVLLYGLLRKLVTRAEVEAEAHRIAAAQDAEARRTAAESTRNSENRLRAILEHLTEGLLITDSAGAPWLWNREFVRMFELPENETRPALPDFWRSVELSTLEGRVLADGESPLQRLRRDGGFRDLRLEVRRRGQSEARVFSFGGTMVPDVAGRSLALLTINDVTERSRAVRALRESEQRFRAVVENIQEVFWVRDLRLNRIVYLSPAFRAVWGREPEYVTSDGLERWFDTVHEDDRAAVVRAASQFPTPEQEYRIVRPDGTVRWVRDQAFIATDPGGGEPERVVGVAQDITERKELEAQFLRAQRMEAIGTLAGGIAHDLNNILAPTLMAAGLLKERLADARDREMLDMVERSARRGAEIIRQLLTFSRGAEGSRMALQPRHIVREVAAIVRETFPRQISLFENAPADLWPVVADATQLQQVLVNLTVNARDAMPDGGRLSISLQNLEVTEADLHAAAGMVPGRYVVITVEDTGTGMSPEVMDRIFDPFFTTKAPGKGTGLGLSTVLGIVRSHGGFVAVQSEPGHGSSFRVYLPAAPSAIDEEPLVSAEVPPAGHGEVILVVDDEDPVREATRHVLEQHNYRVLTAVNGKEALTTFVPERERVSVVVTDMMMPEMGGVPLVRALLLIKPEVKIIATSGLAEGACREDLLALGVKDVLPKPCGPKALLDTIRRVLEQGATPSLAGPVGLARRADPRSVRPPGM